MGEAGSPALESSSLLDAQGWKEDGVNIGKALRTVKVEPIENPIAKLKRRQAVVPEPQPAQPPVSAQKH
jgi:ribosomal 50S subunit-associated protein YjgA (DUF615 family)